MTVATEETSKGGKVVLVLPVLNPVPVVDSDGKPLGSAHIEGVIAELHLDRNRPETFDFEVQPETLRAHIEVLGMHDLTLMVPSQSPQVLELRIVLEGH